MDKLELKGSLNAVLDRHAERLTSFGEDIFAHPELGFREERTADRVAAELRELGLQPEEGLGLTGVKASLRGAAEGPTVCVIGELDALPVPEHPNADAHTGAAHACGHNAQITHMLGVARALVESEAMRHLAGSVVFLAVPAEEYVDLDWREEQARAGKLEFFGGKAELLRNGALDGVDMAMMVHATGSPEARPLGISWDMNGLVAKRVRFIGKAAHAAASPDRAVNALNAATLALQAIHMQRETFREKDRIRVHPIITRGGSAINVVPHDVRLETFVRGATYEAILEAEAKVDRALKAGAMAIGCGIEIETLPGYMPLHVHRELGELFQRNATDLLGEQGWGEAGPNAASTDAGDLSHVMPMLHPSHGGCAGINHAADFRLVDHEMAYITPAKAMAATLVDLLSDNAAEARRVLAEFQPAMTRDQYFAHMRQLQRTEREDYS